MGTHSGEIPFKCTKCDKYFSRSSSLKEHERIHTEEKPFNCTECKEFLNSWRLEGTLEDSHGRDSIQVPKVWQELLTIKLLRDTGEKPFKCTKRDKCFSRPSSLKEHERTHTEEKTFNGSKCDKSFSKSDHIKTLANPYCRPLKCTLWIEIFGTTGCSRAEKFLDE